MRLISYKSVRDVEIVMRKHRKVETDEERSERNKRAAQRKIDDAQAADDAVDAKIRRNLNLYGA